MEQTDRVGSWGLGVLNVGQVERVSSVRSPIDRINCLVFLNLVDSAPEFIHISSVYWEGADRSVRHLYLLFILRVSFCKLLKDRTSLELSESRQLGR